MKSLIVVLIVLLSVSTAIIIFLLTLERWDMFTDIVNLPIHQPERLVVAMATFSTRIEMTALQVIDDLLTHQSFDRLIVTVSLDHRSEKGSCLFLGECVENKSIAAIRTVHDCLTVFGRHFGAFDQVQAPHEGFEAFVHRKIYLLIMKIPDYGPATKLLGALHVERDPSTIIVTVDDDSFYYPYYINRLAYHTPVDGALGVMHQFINAYRQTAIINTPRAMRFFFEGYGIQIRSWLMGVTGIAYRVKYFQDDIFTEARNLTKDCFLNDDVWLGGYLKKHNIKRYVYFGPSLSKHVRHATESLSSLPGAQDRDIVSCAKQYGFEPSYITHGPA